jgi:predicted component of type VI protein secretion system
MSSAEKTVMFAMPNLLTGHLACVAGTTAGRSWELTAGTFTIGRLDEHDMCLSSEPGVSKTHAKIMGQGDHYILVDQESRNGTLLNGQPIQRAELFDGDEIRICGCLLRFTQVGGRPRRAAPTAPPPAPAPMANDGAPTLAFQAPTAAPPAIPTGPQIPMPMASSPPMMAPPMAAPMMPAAAMVAVPAPSTGKVLGAWYAAGLVGSLLLGGAASAALIATAPEPTPPTPAVAIAPTTPTPEPTPVPAPPPPAPVAVVDAGVVEASADAGVAAVPTAVEPTPVEPTPAPAPTPEPVAVAAADVVEPAAAESTDDAAEDDKPKTKRVASSGGGSAGPFPASVDTGHFEVLKSRSGGRVKTALADGAQVAKGTVVVTFETSADAGEIATLQDRIASLEGVEGDEAKRDLKAAKQKLAALEGGQNAAPVIATMDGVLTGFSATPGAILKAGEGFGRVVDTNVTPRVKVTVARGTRAKSGQKVMMNLKSGGSISGTVVAVNGRVVLVDPGSEPAENIDSVAF